MITINTRLTIANKTGHQQQLVLINSNELEGDNLHMKMKSQTIDVDPSSISTHELDLDSSKLLIGIVNTEVTLDSPIGMLKEIELKDELGATITINTNKSVSVK